MIQDAQALSFGLRPWLSSYGCLVLVACTHCWQLLVGTNRRIVLKVFFGTKQKNEYPMSLVSLFTLVRPSVGLLEPLDFLFLTPTTNLHIAMPGRFSERAGRLYINSENAILVL